MKTAVDEAYFAEYGVPSPDRFQALLRALRAQANDAYAAAQVAKAAGDTHRGAMLGGKCTALHEAYRMLEDVLEGHSLHPRRYSSAKARTRAFLARKAARRDVGVDHS